MERPVCSFLCFIYSIQHPHHLPHHPIRQRPHLRIRPVLDRMGHVKRSGLKTQRGGLGTGGGLKLAGGDKERGQATPFKIGCVVYTTRGAGPSIGQGFDNQVAFAGDLLAQSDRRNAGVGGFAIAFGL